MGKMDPWERASRCGVRLVVAAAILALVGVAFLIAVTLHRLHPLAFDSDVWKQEDRIIRARMAFHVDFPEALMGRSEEELLEQLGPPDNQKRDETACEVFFFYRLEQVWSWDIKILTIDIIEGTVKEVTVGN